MTSRYRQGIDYDTGGSERLYSHKDICPGKPDCVHEEEESMTDKEIITALTKALEAMVQECLRFDWEPECMFQNAFDDAEAALALAKDHKERA